MKREKEMLLKGKNLPIILPVQLQSIKKSKKKPKQYQSELNDRILQLAEKEHDQVNLKLSAIRAKIKRKLNPDEIDDLLHEIKDLTRDFLNRKRQRQQIASVSVQPTMSTLANAVMVMPPPSLQRQPIIHEQQQTQVAGGTRCAL